MCCGMKNDSNLRLVFEVLKFLKHLENVLKPQVCPGFLNVFEEKRNREAVKNFRESVTNNLHASETL